ncbi:hypothetical protein DVK85_09695 [Flavobacterium arcticum]|uniref:Uncharacterized protein n=1 Tax=Flavobacterium arcticum TaxID=1784713 RepID=A0A345HD32_9FLAO|nr:hypothetical protein [Flavobacterium arcticum]AXG74492.1 hypothetical protein DVK85_09695 [Flavobacterium arcticum]KAF2512387.1 hypothetical protein E0W72_03965 [Flavobacterium arcticum]
MTKKLFWRLFIFEVGMFATTFIFTSFTNWKDFDKENLLGIMISVVSIIIAIIITYLFSKLFFEKAIMIERKKEIDKISKKITYLRRIAYHIVGFHDFWRLESVSIKSKIDSKYPELTYEIYRGDDEENRNKISQEERDQVDNDISMSGQAYLALKGLQDTRNSFEMFTEFNPKNYSIEDIQRYDEYVSSVWYFLDKPNQSMYDFNRVNSYSLEFVKELYFKIMNKPINDNEYRTEIKELFNHFTEDVFKKHLYLNSLNKNRYFNLFRYSFYNMLIFLIVLILSVFVYVVQGSEKFEYIATLFLLTLFISNTIDLIIITYQSIKSELNVEEVYSI